MTELEYQRQLKELNTKLQDLKLERSIIIRTIEKWVGNSTMSRAYGEVVSHLDDEITRINFQIVDLEYDYSQQDFDGDN